jgi:mannosyl-3-phosphoglycerate phosphatase family protein
MSIPIVLYADVDDAFHTAEVTKNDAPLTREILDRENIVLVLCSHMTRVELEMCQQHLGIAHPFICENGAAVLIPRGYFPFEAPRDRDLAGHHLIELGGSYAEVVDLLHRTARRLNIDVVGFSDMSVQQVAAACDLSLSQARLAKFREYDEPCRVINGHRGARERLVRALHTVGLTCTYRGAYDHVGAAGDRGTSVELLTALFRRTFGPLITLGLGSAANGSALLQRVDMPFIVANDCAPNSLELERIPQLRSAPGTVGWIETVADIARRARQQLSARRRVRTSE